jgi:predicted metal-dependent enzyme (double-stranded beta helix superfamily)
VKTGEKVFGAGDVVSFLPDSIHSVTNDTDAVTVSLHVYGKHVNYTTRWQFDPETRIAKEFKVVQTG